ncbi:alpha/beta fold hydrolase [Nocardia sp. NPDC051981]|uniref:alpha/beta fold hydrolase n=1 Tax=Nocardia sp. NPDC051981 TaxID=3155417 RepID=UPI00344151AC
MVRDVTEHHTPWNQSSSTTIDVQQPFAPSLLAETARPTPYDAPGAAGGPDLYINAERFRETFCADAPVDLAQIMGAAQRPLAAAALAEKATEAGWKQIPSWYQVARHDNAINPEAQRFMAKRMGSTIDEIDSSHTAFISHFHQPRQRHRFVVPAAVIGQRCAANPPAAQARPPHQIALIAPDLEFRTLG